jgi:hypothetical protein
MKASEALAGEGFVGKSLLQREKALAPMVVEI